RRTSAHGLLSTMAATLGDGPAYALEGSVFIGGAVVQWLRDGLGIIAKASETEGLARSVPDAAGVYLVPAFAGLGAPWWDMDARGGLFGLTRGATRAHVARAALEAIAYQCTDLVHAMEQDAGMRLESLSVDGGACANGFLMQFQADVAGLALRRASVLETTALGAASLAGLACGVWNLADLKKASAQGTAFLPAMPLAQREGLLAGWHEAVDRVRNHS
ncbi:MAG: glycerol kinase, partial [Desulfovibrio sp.]|nr:glycerol kinase [Desulfovibrio sp.]